MSLHTMDYDSPTKPRQVAEVTVMTMDDDQLTASPAWSEEESDDTDTEEDSTDAPKQLCLAPGSLLMSPLLASIAHLPATKSLLKELLQQEQQVHHYLRSVKVPRADKAAKSAQGASAEVSKWLAFKGADGYDARYVVRPDVHSAGILKVRQWTRLTPDDYHRCIFHVDIDVSGTPMEHYKLGEALAVYAHNPPNEVTEVLRRTRTNGQQLVALDDVFEVEEGYHVQATAEHVVSQYLDIMGKPGRDFIKALYPHAADVQEKVELAELTLERNSAAFLQLGLEGVSYVDLLRRYPSCRPTLKELVRMIPMLKQRVYSISSASSYCKGSLQLLVVAESWETEDKRMRYGLCSNYLAGLQAKAHVIGALSHSVMTLPEDPMAPVMMAGLGTGLAPFRAFIQERAHQMQHGNQVGEMHLYFGARHKQSEFMYGDELERFHEQGPLTALRCAWSRDSAKKVYIQHLLQEDADVIWKVLGAPESCGKFYLCGPTWPVPDVQEAVLSAFESKGQMSRDQAEARLQVLQETGRFVLEVY